MNYTGVGVNQDLAAPAAGSSNGNVRRGLIAKLAEVMAAVHRVPKRGRNAFHGYNYSTEADIADAIRGELAQRNVILIPCILGATRVPVGEKGSFLTILDMEFTFKDGDTGEELTRRWMGAGTDKEDKGLYKAMTGGEKYWLLKFFLVPTGDDPERDDKSGGEDTTASASAESDMQDEGDKTPFDGGLLQELAADHVYAAKFREGTRNCPGCGQTGTIIKGKQEYGGGWVCWKKGGGGCGWKCKDVDPPTIDTPSPEPQPQLTGEDLAERAIYIKEYHRLEKVLHLTPAAALVYQKTHLGMNVTLANADLPDIAGLIEVLRTRNGEGKFVPFPSASEART